MTSNVTRLPVAVVLALAYQASAAPLQAKENSSFERLSAMIADGSLPLKPAANTQVKEFAQWFNFNQWNNCISGTWRNC